KSPHGVDGLGDGRHDRGRHGLSDRAGESAEEEGGGRAVVGTVDRNGVGILLLLAAGRVRVLLGRPPTGTRAVGSGCGGPAGSGGETGSGVVSSRAIWAGPLD